MKVLAIDSSAKSSSVAIIEDEKILSEFYLNNGLTHSHTLAPMIKNILDNTNLSLNEIDAFAVSNGPGSFTGIRIGISIVQGMAMVLNKPCVPVSTLYSMAFNNLDTDYIICASMDARRNQVYNALFETNGNLITRLTPDRAISIDELSLELKNLGKKVIFVGDGADLCYNNMKNILLESKLAPENTKYQKASSVAFAAFNLFKEQGFTMVEDLKPTYLRLSQAERELKNKNNGGIL